MIIKNLNLRSFGKFNNKSISFGDGLNIVYGENESGKSTVSTALKTWLYPDITVKKKYKKNCIPLGETKGSFDVSAVLDNGDIIESYINLGKTNAKTTVKTLKKPLDETVNTGDIDVGEYLFSLDEEMFDSVFYIRDLSGYKSICENKAEVSEKLSKNGNKNIVDVDVSKALEDIKSELMVYGRKTSTGKIFPLTERLSEIEEDLFNLENIKNSVKNTEEKIEYIKEKLLENEKKLLEFSRMEEYGARYEKYLNTKNQLKLREKIKALKEKLDLSPLETPKISEEDLLFIKKHSLSDFKESSRGKILLISSLLSILAGAALGFLNPYLFNIGWLFPVFLALWAIENKKNSQLKKEEEKYTQILKGCNIKDYDDYTKKVQDAERKETENKIKAAEISHLEEGLRDYDSAYAGIFMEEPKLDINEIKESIKKLGFDSTELKIELARIKEQKKNAFNNLPDFDALIAEKNELEKKVENLNEEYEISKDAYNILEETSKSFKAAYIPYLQKRTAEILGEIFSQNIDYFSIKEDFSFELRSQGEGEIKSEEYLSAGTGDMVNFALRLAIYELMCDNYSIPLILDDCFIELDDIRFEKIMKYLHKNFKNQIIYFTAHKRVFNLPLENSTVINI